MNKLHAKVLLVDDDLDFLDLNRKVLEAEGYRVITCSEPQAAFKAVEAERPDLVVTDLMMSALDSGFSLSRALKADPRFSGIPVIVVTAVASQRGFDFSPRGLKDLKAMGADAYFDKPVDPKLLTAKVEELISYAGGGGADG